MTQAKIGLVPLFSVTFALLAFFIGLVAMTIYLIHRYTILFYSVVCEKDIGDWKTFSFLLMLLGFLASLGMSMVANFQEGPILLSVHNTGAFTFFIGIILYFWGQLIIAYSLKPRMVSIHLTNIRLVLTLTASSLLVFHMVCLFAEPFAKSAGKQEVNQFGIARVPSNDPHFLNHIATTVSEWILALLVELQILLYMYDFASVSLHTPKMSVQESNIFANKQIASQTDQIYYAHEVNPYSGSRLIGEFSDTTTQRRLPRVDHPSTVLDNVQPSLPLTLSKSQDTFARAKLAPHSTYNHVCRRNARNGSSAPQKTNHRE
uniref:DNA damage-regulated autophagy modulator protein 2 n=1 Tax=Heterorhabditis bacteriophora TaxID=37862 RepID=A0A1I7WL78_HETBA